MTILISWHSVNEKYTKLVKSEETVDFLRHYAIILFLSSWNQYTKNAAFALSAYLYRPGDAMKLSQILSRLFARVRERSQIQHVDSLILNPCQIWFRKLLSIGKEGDVLGGASLNETRIVILFFNSVRNLRTLLFGSLDRVIAQLQCFFRGLYFAASATSRKGCVTWCADRFEHKQEIFELSEFGDGSSWKSVPKLNSNCKILFYLSPYLYNPSGLKA